ncbi:MAG: hypothetical protein RLZZ58_2059 [Pseudomonadota bacterium]|jgi:drug/metabolite transporter (DMT)-like permease
MTARPLTLLSPRVLIPFVIITLIWSLTWIVIVDQLAVVPPSWSVTYRFAVSALAMFMLALLRREHLLLSGRAWGFAALLGTAQFALNFNFVYRAEAHITSGLVAVLFALLIVPNTLLGRIFLKTPLERRFLIGGAIAVTGVGMMIAHEVNLAGRGLDAVLAGTALTLAAVLSASTANVMQGSRLGRAQSMIVLLAWAMLFGAGVDAVFAWATVGPPVWDPRPSYLAGVLYLGVIGSAVAFPLYFGIIRDVGPGPAAWSGVLIPVIAMFVSTLVEGYMWAPLSVVGGVLVIAGLVFAVMRRGPPG